LERTDKRNEDFRELRRRKRKSLSQEQLGANKKPSMQQGNPPFPLPRKPAAARSIYDPLLRSLETDSETVEQGDLQGQQKQAPANKTNRSPPIMLTSTTNLIHLQNNTKCTVKGSFEFRNTRNGICVSTKEMENYATIKPYFESEGLHYFTSHPKSDKPMKTVIRRFPSNTPVEDIYKGRI
jgi:hypothetical protein